MKSYKRTKIACYLGFVTQAIVANFVPLLFLRFNSEYNISLGGIALIPSCFFLTQLLVDIICAKYVDRIGYRKSIVASLFCSAFGLVLLAFLPDLLPIPFLGIIISVIIYAIGSGLIEVLCSPIMEACPFENKEATMSLLHSFYCWGSVGTILFSTVFFYLFGITNWRWLTLVFALIPAINIYNFLVCPIEPLVKEGDGLGIKQLFKKPAFIIALALMVASGASELSMAQWASAYSEAALKLPKAIGDLLGPCLFACMMGISRTLYGKYGDKVDLRKFMMASGLLCFFCYLLTFLATNPIFGLLGCITCGFSVGIMWPGTLSISSKTINNGGTAMFALLAMAGDLGGSIGPAFVGKIAEYCNGNIGLGLGAGIVFPLTLLVCLFLLKTIQNN